MLLYAFKTQRRHCLCFLRCRAMLLLICHITFDAMPLLRYAILLLAIHFRYAVTRR